MKHEVVDHGPVRHSALIRCNLCPDWEKAAERGKSE
jgi:hypothetical protein